MAYSLFVDSSHNLSIGLLDENFNWLDYKKYANRKSSGIFHGLVEELLTAHKTDLFKLDRVFYGAGPGSYTGIRLVEGFAQILGWKDVKVNSFYHFELPYLLGVQEGTWISEAYKGEYFLYSWKGSESHSKLLDKKDIKSELTDDRYIISQGDLDDITSVSITDLIKESSKDIFSKIVEADMKRDPFYYRSIENEFSKPKKNWRKS